MDGLQRLGESFRMKRVLFLFKYDLERDFNLKGKFDGQMRATYELGYDVWFIGYYKRAFYLVHFVDGQKELMFKRGSYYFPTYTNTLLFSDLHMSAQMALSRMQFYCVYFRFMPIWHRGYRFFIDAVNSTSIILEYPSYPYVKERLNGFARRLASQYWMLNFSKVKPYITLYSAIGQDIPLEIDGRPVVEIKNAIDINCIRERTPIYDPNRFHFIAMASMCAWHGYDRLIRSIAASDKKDRIIFHLVGGDGDGSKNKWRELVKLLGINEQVTFHPEVHGTLLEKMIDEADIGIAALGEYRRGLTITSALKIREYLARGLPFIYAINDPDLHENLFFCMRVENDNGLIPITPLIQFAEKMRSIPHAAGYMREYAANNVSWITEMKKVFDRFNKEKSTNQTLSTSGENT